MQDKSLSFAWTWYFMKTLLLLHCNWIEINGINMRISLCIMPPIVTRGVQLSIGKCKLFLCMCVWVHTFTYKHTYTGEFANQCLIRRPYFSVQGSLLKTV